MDIHSTGEENLILKIRIMIFRIKNHPAGNQGGIVSRNCTGISVLQFLLGVTMNMTTNFTK